jgi:hypothetical protein
MTEDALDPVAVQQHLDAFLVDNQELEQLNARLGSFNLFNVLRVDKVEIRHSNVLAWLLSPNETHGLGATFLRRFLSRLLMENDLDGVSLTPAQIELMNFSSVEVWREWKSIDILALDRDSRWCLLIENKIKSSESRGQLNRYAEAVRDEFPDYQVILVYLTLEGDDPSDEGLEAGFVPLSYAQVLDLAVQIIGQHRSRIPADAATFLDHYLETLRRLTMQDEELIKLCKTIYRKHREAIDLIVEYGAASNVQDACLTEIEAQTECEYAIPAIGGVWFLPKALGEHVPAREMTAWRFVPNGKPIACWYYYNRRPNILRLILEVGPMADAQKRIALLQAIQDAGIKVRKTAMREEAKYTRLISNSQRLKPGEDGDPDLSEESVRDAARALWTKLWAKTNPLTDVLSKFDWS